MGRINDIAFLTRNPKHISAILLQESSSCAELSYGSLPFITYAFFKHSSVRCARHEAGGIVISDDAVFSYSTVVSVLNFARSCGPDPRRPTKRFSSCSKSTLLFFFFFLLLLFGSYLRLFLISCFFLPASSLKPWGLSVSWLPIAIQLLEIRGGIHTLVHKNQNCTDTFSRSTCCFFRAGLSKWCNTFAGGQAACYY
jgi:hypothetical protein